jgi:hypothetical protein
LLLHRIKAVRFQLAWCIGARVITAAGNITPFEVRARAG